MIKKQNKLSKTKVDTNNSRDIIMQPKRGFFIDALHIFILSSFAVAQPLFDLLSQNAEFFVARRSEPLDIMLLIIILCLLIPMMVILIEIVAGLFSRHLRKAVHGFVLICLVAIIVLPAMEKIIDFPAIALIVGAVIIGVAFTIAYIRFQPVRTFLTVLSPALLIFPGLFLFNSPVFRIAFPAKDPSVVQVKVKKPAPIIMVVFDEFPVTSLMDENRQIDPIRYPNFAALARDSYWFRNTITVSRATLQAVPSILTGSYPDQSRMPTAADYPNNLFTLLDRSYRMKVSESHTMLSPKTLNVDVKPLVQRMYLMLSDLSAVYFHILLPSDLSGRLPIITQTWKYFRIDAEVDKAHVQSVFLEKQKHASYRDRAMLFSEFVNSISVSDKPTLYFAHFMLPHVPWEYLPSRRIYTETEIPGLDIQKEQWGNNDWLVIQGYQRHLLQVGFVDKLVGDLLAKLKTLNLYDKSLIVITADHGVNFWPNKSRRHVLKEDPMSILGVPLIIKAPNQKKSIISDSNLKTIDILPTIADILDIDLPWHTDGRSAIRSTMEESASNIRYHSLKRKLNVFGSGAEPEGLFKIGPNNELVNRTINTLNLVEGNATIELDHANNYANMDPNASITYSYIAGRVLLNGNTGIELNLAIGINGKIHAVTRTLPMKGGIREWSAMVPETAFQKGKNKVEVFVVYESNGQLQLVRTRRQSTITYSLASSNERGEIINSSKGITIPVVPNALKAYLDIVDVQSDKVEFSGWAADLKKLLLPEAIVIFVNEKFLYFGRCNLERPDLVAVFNKPELLRAGFKFRFPLSLFKNIDHSQVRLFAISQDRVASELIYPEGYKLGKKS